MPKSNFELASRKFVPSLFNILGNLLDFKPFKTPRELAFVLIRIVFVKKSANFNSTYAGFP